MGRRGLHADLRLIDTVGVLELDGELDIATAAALRAALDGAVARIPGIGALVLDLAGVRFCGARTMLELSATACPVTRRGGRLFLARFPRAVRRLVGVLDVPHRPHPLADPADPHGLELLPGPFTSRRPPLP